MKHTKDRIFADWRQWFANRRDDGEYQKDILRQFIELMERHGATPAELEAMEAMKDEYMMTLRRVVASQERECPMGFFEPSWEQAQVLNAWSPQYEPDIAPNGYQSIAVFSANRIGKTLSVIMNTLLWLVPNDPDWKMFETLTDPPIYNRDLDPSSGIKRPSRGTYTVFPRPDWQAWRRTGRLVYPWKSDSPMGPCEVWHGCENDTDWHGRIAGKLDPKHDKKDGYLAWIPKYALGMRTDGGTAIYKQERTLETRYGQSIVGKTYGSDTQAWAGKAARIVNMDEGFEVDKLDESTTRVEGGGYYLWAYTPTEARNVGRKSQIAHDCFKGKRLLVGATKYFTSFSMEDAPQQVLDTEKKAADLARFAKMGKVGEARAKGGFFESSPRVFGNFDEDKHVLPWSASQIVAAMRGDGPEEIVRHFIGANIIRGFDEGTAHPTTCSWVAILRGGEYVLFREFSEANLSVTQRCHKIIELSRNKREISKFHPDESLRQYVEVVPADGMQIRRTFADSKIYRRDQTNPQDDWPQVYRKQGLRMERATNIGPQARCDYVNDMFLPDPTRKHLVTRETPGHRLYISVDCEIMKERLMNYLHQQFSTGPNAGQFTGKPQQFGDDEIDSLCYACCSKLRWKDPLATHVEETRGDPLTGYIRR